MDIWSHPILQALFNTSSPRILVRANVPRFTIVAQNDAHKEASFMAGKNITGKSLWDIYKPNDVHSYGWLVLMNTFMKAMETNKTLYVPNYKFDTLPSEEISASHNTRLDLEITHIPDKDGKTVYLMATIKDISQDLEREIQIAEKRKRKAKADLKEVNRRLQFALEAGKLGSYDLDFNTGKIISNDQWKQNYGLPPDVDFNFEDVLASIVPEHKDYVQEKIEFSVSNKAILQAEYQIKWPNNSLHWLSISGKPYFDKEGKITRMVGVSYDITQEIADKEELRKTTDILNQAIASAGLGVWHANLENDSLTISKQAEFLHGLPENKVLTLSESIDMIDVKYKDYVMKTILDAVKSRNSFEIEYLIHPMDGGNARWLKSTGQSYYDEFDQPLMVSGTMMDITEKKEDDIRKNNFISMVAHELKTPLTTVKAYLQLLLSDGEFVKNNFASNAVSKAELQVNRMVKLINGFLNISKLESGDIDLTQQTFVFFYLVKEIMSGFNQVAVGHEIVLAENQKAIVRADREKIGQVISNYLSNAIKYSDQGKPIEVKCIVVDGQVQLSVSDEGIGIKSQHLDKLFHRYYRVETQPTNFIAGFGIGLYLCYEIIQRHGGSVWVKSKAGKGSTFFFNLPISIKNHKKIPPQDNIRR